MVIKYPRSAFPLPKNSTKGAVMVITMAVPIMAQIILVYDTDFILGGYIAPFLCTADLEDVHRKIEQMTPFPEKKDFLFISQMPKHNIAIGAALPYIQDFLTE